MEVKPIIREKKSQECTEDICPHCNQPIGEKALYLIDQDDSIPWEKKRWQHRSCGGEILMPVAENPFSFAFASKKITASRKSEIARYLRFADKLDREGLFKEANRIAEVFEISDRYTALGIPHPDPDTVCRGHCEGTGFVPVKKDHSNPVFRKLWEEAEALEPTDDGYHFVECPECSGSGKKRPEGHE